MCKISAKICVVEFHTHRAACKTYLHHTLVRVQFAELFFDLLHSFLHTLLLSQQALLRGERETQKGKKKKCLNL